MAALVSGDTIPRPENRDTRRPWHRWHRLYRADYDTKNDAAPAYVRSWGRMLAGLMQGQPVGYVNNPESPPLTDAELADLTDDGVKLASGEGVAYARFVGTDDGWQPMIVGTSSVDATWRNNQMVDAVVFKVLDGEKGDGQKTVIYTEEYGLEEAGSFRAAAWQATKREDGWQLDRQLPPSDTGNEFQQMLTDTRLQTPRPLIPTVWAFEDSTPVPVYVGNEQAVFGLARLWTQEQEDAELVRRRIFVHEKMVTQQGHVFYGADGRTKLIDAGFTRDNVVALQSGGSANDPSTGGIDTMEFGDNLVMRDRIERRENSLLEQIGISPQTIGRSVTGRSDSAAAKRADQQMTLTTIAGPARNHERFLNAVSVASARLNGGDEQARVDVKEGLRQSEAELIVSTREGLQAEAMSTRTRVKRVNPSWTDDEVTEEVARILAETGGAFPIEGAIPSFDDAGQLQ